MTSPHSRIMALAVDPEDFVPFFSSGPLAEVFIDRRVRQSKDNDIDDVATRMRVALLCRRAQDTLGENPSRSRKKAEVAAYVLVRSLSALAVPLTLRALEVIKAVLLPPGGKYIPAPDKWAEGMVGHLWLSPSETFALQIIAHIRARGRVDAYARSALLDLLALHVGANLPFLVGAATGVVMGVIDPGTAEPTKSALGLRLGTKNPERIIAAAERDGRALADIGRSLSAAKQARDIMEIEGGLVPDSILRTLFESRQRDGYLALVEHVRRHSQGLHRHKELSKELAGIGKEIWKRWRGKLMPFIAGLMEENAGALDSDPYSGTRMKPRKRQAERR